MSDEPEDWRDIARATAGDPYTRMVLFLISHGIPFDVAFCLEWPTLVGWTVAISETESGKTFNWTNMSWPD